MSFFLPEVVSWQKGLPITQGYAGDGRGFLSWMSDNKKQILKQMFQNWLYTSYTSS